MVRCVISFLGLGIGPMIRDQFETKSRNLGKKSSKWAAQNDHSIDAIGARGLPGSTPTPEYKYRIPNSSARSVITQFQGDNRNFRSDQVYQIQHRVTSPQCKLVAFSKFGKTREMLPLRP